MVKARFWNNVGVGGPADCWEWQRTRTNKGYGHAWYDGKQWRAHRLAWMLTNGPIPEGMCVLHRCDNPLCCNPGHLFIGTIADNNADRVAKGRSARGEAHGMSILTKVQVLSIRARYAAGEATHRELAVEYGVGRIGIGSIVRRELWTHI